MAQSVLNISKKNKDEIITKIDNNNFFCLSNQECSRRDLFNFVLALGLAEGYPTELENKEGLIRNEKMENDRHLYNAVYFTEQLNEDSEKIEEILNDDKVFSLIEKYVETGFNKLRTVMKEDSENKFMQDLIKDMNGIYKDFQDEYLF